MSYPFQLLQNNYKLAGTAKNKLIECTQGDKMHHRDFNLRKVVCNANLLDRVLDNIDRIKYDYIKARELKSYERNTVSYTRRRRGHPSNTSSSSSSSGIPAYEEDLALTDLYGDVDEEDENDNNYYYYHHQDGAAECCAPGGQDTDDEEDTFFECDHKTALGSTKSRTPRAPPACTPGGPLAAACSAALAGQPARTA